MERLLIADLWSLVFDCLPLIQLDVWFQQSGDGLAFVADAHRGAITDTMVHWAFAHGHTQILKRVSNLSKYQIEKMANDWEPLIPFLVKTDLHSLNVLFQNCVMTRPLVSWIRELLFTPPQMMYSANCIASLALVCDLETFQEINPRLTRDVLLAMIHLETIKEDIFLWIRLKCDHNLLFKPNYPQTSLQVMSVLVRNDCLSTETQNKLLEMAICHRDVAFTRLLMPSELDDACFLSLQTQWLSNVEFLLKHKLLHEKDEQRLSDVYSDLPQTRLMNLVDISLRQNLYLVAMKFWEYVSDNNREYFRVDFNPMSQLSLKCLEFIDGHSNVFDDVYPCLSQSLKYRNCKVWKFFQKQQKLPCVNVLLQWFPVEQFFDLDFIEYVVDDTTDVLALLELAIKRYAISVVQFLMARFVVTDQSFLKKNIVFFCEYYVRSALRMITNSVDLSVGKLQTCFVIALKKNYIDILAELHRIVPNFRFRVLKIHCSDEMLQFLLTNNLTTAAIICRDCCTIGRTKQELLQIVNADLDLTSDLDPKFVKLLLSRSNENIVHG